MQLITTLALDGVQLDEMLNRRIKHQLERLASRLEVHARPHAELKLSRPRKDQFIDAYLRV